MRLAPILTAEAIAQALHTASLPEGAHRFSVRFARLAGVAVPAVVVQGDGATATGRLDAIRDRLLESLQLDQGVPLELRGRCAAARRALLSW